MLHFVWMFLVGILVGAVARWIMPAAEHLSLVMTGLLGVAGSFVGGIIVRLFSPPQPSAPLHPAGILMSIFGAVLLLFLWGHLAP